jgi:predicted nucleotidyltransferase
MKTISPTPYPDVNEMLNLFLNRVHEILGDQFIGMYLHGSLANGGFDEYSDIDVIVATVAAISGQAFSALKEMHEQISKIDCPGRSSWSLLHPTACFTPLRPGEQTSSAHGQGQR